MYCFSCRDPSSASLVFGNAAMSTLSLVSSASMTAVLHLLLICRMLKLGLMLLMFQQAMQSAGNFVLLFRMLLGKLFTASCHAYTLWAPCIPRSKQSVADRQLTGWGPTSLRRAVVDQWDMPIETGLLTWNYCAFYVSHKERVLSLAGVRESMGCPWDRNPLILTNGTQRKAGQ